MPRNIIDHPLLPLVKHFITKSRTGIRLQSNGRRISKGTIQNYGYLLKHLDTFQQQQIDAGKEPLRIRATTNLNAKALTAERNYWKRFYNAFLSYLYREGCHDNYVGSLIKHLRSAFRYIEEDRMIPAGSFYKAFHVPKEEVPIISLSPDRLQMLINDEGLRNRLSPGQSAIRDILVFGCTVALRFGDLISIRKSDIEVIGQKSYLVVHAQKTGTPTRILLSSYCLEIIRRHSVSGRQAVFAPLSLSWFNKRVQQLCEVLGWTEEVHKARSMRGERKTLTHPSRGMPYRFCDAASSHLMRRTAITTMLMNGVPEMVVKKISGHTGDSKAFHRYVNLVQVYMDSTVESHFQKLCTLTGAS